MGKPVHWNVNVIDGIGVFKMQSWNDFVKYLNDKKDGMLSYHGYIWRGQRSSTWLLESKLDRYLKQCEKSDEKDIRKKHLMNFKMSIRGRMNNLPSNNDELWALGQHYGLATPLLDWTSSPYVAAFFAFDNLSEEPDIDLDGKKYFSIFALFMDDIINKCVELKIKNDDCVRFVNPLTNENPRLVSQGGVFTKLPDNSDLELWIKEKFKGETDYFTLMKFMIPYKNEEIRKNVLIALNRMNINHTTLYPDLHGSSEFCNTKLLVSSY